MTSNLLDVSVLIALLDPDHDAHNRVHEWFAHHAGQQWATCAITENGVIRVLSQSRYRNPVRSAEAVQLLTAACATQDHTYWPCDVSLRTTRTRLLGSGQVTGVYLLALAVARGGRFVTLDRNVALTALEGATEDHLVVV